MGVTYFDEKLGKGILEVKEALRQAEKHNELSPELLNKLNSLLVGLCEVYDRKL